MAGGGGVGTPTVKPRAIAVRAVRTVSDLRFLAGDCFSVMHSALMVIAVGLVQVPPCILERPVQRLTI